MFSEMIVRFWDFLCSMCVSPKGLADLPELQFFDLYMSDFLVSLFTVTNGVL